MRGRGDEFQARNRQLPADLDQTRLFGRSEQSRVDLAKTPLGTPPADCDVRSVYDARPVNGFDFNIAVSIENAQETPQSVFNFEFVVDESYVAVVRSLHHWFEPAPASLSNRSDVKLTMALNGTPQFRLIDIPIGVESDGLIQMYLVADEFNTVRAQLTLSDAVATDFTAWLIFYGNYIQKTGVPANQQIANCRTGAAPSLPPSKPPPIIAPTPRPMPAPAPAPVPPPPPAPTPVQQLRRDLCPIKGPTGQTTLGPCPTRRLGYIPPRRR